MGGKLPTVFQDYTGLLDSQGNGTARLVIPNTAALVGIRLHSAFLTIKAEAPFNLKSNLKSISDTFTFTITT